MNTVSEKRRVLSFDVLRVLAALAVVVIHASAYYAAEFPAENYRFIVGNFFDSFARCAVPVFLMLSGALILREEVSFSWKKMWKNILRLLLVFYFWSFLYMVYYSLIQPIQEGKKILFSDCLSAFLKGHYHMWYIPLTISLYLVTPILKKLVSRENRLWIGWLLLLSLVFQFSKPLLKNLTEGLPMRDSLLQDLLYRYDPEWMGIHLTYYILGWYLTQTEIPKKYRLLLYGAGLGGLLTVMLGSYFYGRTDVHAFERFYDIGTVCVFLYSGAVFLFFYHLLPSSGNRRVNSVFEKLSALTMGIYMMHPFVLHMLNNQGRLWYAHWDIPVKVMLTFLISLFLSYLLSKIPGLKKVIHM